MGSVKGSSFKFHHQKNVIVTLFYINPLIFQNFCFHCSVSFIFGSVKQNAFNKYANFSVSKMNWNIAKRKTVKTDELVNGNTKNKKTTPMGAVYELNTFSMDSIFCVILLVLFFLIHLLTPSPHQIISTQCNVVWRHIIQHRVIIYDCDEKSKLPSNNILKSGL